MKVNKYSSAISLFLIFTFFVSSLTTAQEIGGVPIGPGYQSTQKTTTEQAPAPYQLFPQQRLLPEQVKPSEKVQIVSLEEPDVQGRAIEDTPSVFEQYLSEKIEITETQFEILKGFKGLTITDTLPQSLVGKISIPFKVFKPVKDKDDKTVKRADIGIGYIIGSPDVISSAFTLLGIKSPLVVSTDIKHFGHDLFKEHDVKVRSLTGYDESGRPIYTFEPPQEIPVGPGYVVGPGDEIRITVWGKIEGQWNTFINRDGNIIVPKIGSLGVTGLTFKELKELLNKELSKYYTGFEMNVSLGSLRTIKVYVVGNAQSPGAYTIYSISTLINALFEAGGPDKKGSMRDIQVKRNGKTIVHFDLYDFLLKGDKTKDIRLMPEDVIFIPPVGPLVGIAGNVNNPAIYELKNEVTLGEIISLSGGLNPFAFKNRVQIERVINKTKQVVFDSNIESSEDVKLHDGDLVKIFPVYKYKRTVRIAGAVHREGKYGFKQGLTIRDLISMTGGLKHYAFMEEAELTRITISSEGPKTEEMTINLEMAIRGEEKHNIHLKEDDYLFIRTIPEWQLYRFVTISGEVNFPGSYTIRKGEQISSLIQRAGGFTKSAYIKGAVFKREEVREIQQRQLGEMIDRLEQQLVSVSTKQVATATSAEEAQIIQHEVEQRRQFINKLRTVKAEGRLTLELTSLDKFKLSFYDIELKDGDSIFIPSDPNTIQVIGSVNNQNAFVFDKGRLPEHYIDLAGGLTINADKDSIYVLKVDGTAVKGTKGAFYAGWNGELNRLELGSRTILDSGDTIVVPEKLEKIPWMRNIKDITQILFQIATIAGVLSAIL